MRWSTLAAWASAAIAAPAVSTFECPVGEDGLCQEAARSVELSGLWALDPNTLVYDGHPTPLDLPIGFVTMEGTRGKYTLGNDINFSLAETDGGYLVSITGETVAAVDGAESVAEELVRAVFLHDGNKIAVLPISRHRVVVGSSRGSVQLVPLPRLAEGLLPHAEELSGVWVAAVANNDSLLQLRLNVVHTSPRHILLTLDGVNSHHLEVRVISEVPGVVRGVTNSIVVEPARSTSLVPDDAENAVVEGNLVRLLELCNRLEVVVPTAAEKKTARVPPSSSNGVRLQFWNDAKPELKATFQRPRFTSRLFRESPAAYWSWIPDTAEGFRVPEGTAGVPVMLQVRQATDSTTILDLFADSATHLRAVILETAQPGGDPLRAVQQISNGDHPELAALLLDLLHGIESLDVDASGQFLSLVTSDKSLAFESVAYPSPGVWVLDHRYSVANSKAVVPEGGYMAHQVRLRIEQRESGSVHATLLGRSSAARVEFVIRNVAPWPSQQELRVTSVARRHGVVSGNRQVEIDEMVANFLHKGLAVEVQRGDGETLMRFSDATGSAAIVFVHGSQLAAALAGHWTLTGEESLRLVPAGVGELRGTLRMPNGEVTRLRLRESADNVGTGYLSSGGEEEQPTVPLLPSRWTVEEHRVPLQASPKLKAALRSITGEAFNYQGLPAKTVDVKLRNKNLLEVKVAGHTESTTDKTQFWSRTLPRSVMRRIEGDWFIEFVAVEGKEGTTVVAAKDSASARLLLTLELTTPALDPKELEINPMAVYEARSLAVYEGRIMELPSRRVLQRFTMEVNPFAVVRLTALKEVSQPGTPEAVQPELETKTAEFIVMVAAEKTEEPLRAEVSAGELTFSDGGNVLVMSRGVPSKPMSLPLLLLWEGAIAPENSETVVVYAQMGNGERRRLLEDESPRVDPMAMKMMASYRRRLLAATNLDSHLRETLRLVEVN